MPKKPARIVRLRLLAERIRTGASSLEASRLSTSRPNRKTSFQSCLPAPFSAWSRSRRFATVRDRRAWATPPGRNTDRAELGPDRRRCRSHSFSLLYPSPRCWDYDQRHAVRTEVDWQRLVRQSAGLTSAARGSTVRGPAVWHDEKRKTTLDITANDVALTGHENAVSKPSVRYVTRHDNAFPAKSRLPLRGGWRLGFARRSLR